MHVKGSNAASGLSASVTSDKGSAATFRSIAPGPDPCLSSPRFARWPGGGVGISGGGCEFSARHNPTKAQYSSLAATSEVTGGESWSV